MSPQAAEDELDLDNLDPSNGNQPADPPEPDDPEDPDEPEDPNEPQDPDDPEEPHEPQDPDLGRLGAQPQQRQVPRSENRIRTLVEESRRKDQELAEVRNRLDVLAAQLSGGGNQRETPEQRATRLALLSPEDRIREEFREAQTENTRNMQLMQFQLMDSSDRASFEAKATVDPLYKKWQSEVERELSAMRRKNQNVPREDLMYYLVGKAAMQARGGKEVAKQRSAAESRVRRATTRAPNSRSDVGSPAQSRTRQQQSLEKRLENVAI
ncbi:MAG TPA: hypothetical protein VF748_14820 [Candidatus Acidoferrum sp.]